MDIQIAEHDIGARHADAEAITAILNSMRGGYRAVARSGDLFPVQLSTARGPRCSSVSTSGEVDDARSAPPPRVSMYEGDQSKVDSVVSWFCRDGEEGGRGQARVPHQWLLTTLY